MQQCNTKSIFITSSRLKCNQTISSTTIHHIKTGQYDLLCKTVKNAKRQNALFTIKSKVPS